MRISKLTLENIGPFVGIHELDLSTNKDQNIVLIGGKNGAGKTTILGSIKLGLFGARYYGYQTETKTYFNEVEKFLNASKANKNERFGITISFDVTAGYQKNLYSIERSWKINDKGLSEEVTLYEQFDELKQLVPKPLTEELINKIFNEYPPRLIDSFVFDGEAINEMIRHDRISDFLSQSFNSLFRLNMMNDLSIDLQNYIKNSNSDKSLNQEELALIEKKNELKSKLNQVKLTNQQLDVFQSLISDYRTQIDAIFSQFERMGGLDDANKKAIQFFLNEQEKTRTKNSQLVRNFLENDVFLSLLKPQIEQLNKAVIQELPQYLLKHVELANEYIGKHVDLSKMLKELALLSNSEAIFSNHEELLNFIKTELPKAVKEHKEIRKLILISNISSDELIELKAKLNKSDVTELQSYMDQISNLHEEIEHVEDQYRVKKSESVRVNEEYETLKINYEKVESDYKKKQKLTNSFSMALQVIEVLDVFRQKELDRRLKDVAALSIQYFSKTHGKKGFIKSIDISELFDIRITSVQGHYLQLEKLSAGEKQLLIGSIIKAMFTLAHRKEFFVFDTPLARLDQSNRKSFIQNVILPMSEQVIILSTNEEITGLNYNLVKDHIYQSYTLVYDSKTATSQIKQGYEYERV